MNIFNGISNDEIKTYFLNELYSKTEFVQEYQPNVAFDPEREYGKHITASQDKMKVFIIDTLRKNGSTLNDEELNNFISEKIPGIYKLIAAEIEFYILKVKVDYR